MSFLFIGACCSCMIHHLLAASIVVELFGKVQICVYKGQEEDEKRRVDYVV